MFARQLIGPQAGEIIDLPFHAYEACLAGGTVATVTDEEITKAGLRAEPEFVAAKADAPPHGYRLDYAEGGGFDVFDAGGVNLTSEINIPNKAAAISFAIDHANVGAGTMPSPAADDDGADEIPHDWRDLHHTKIIALAKRFDESVTTKAEAIAVLEAAEKASS